MLARGKPDQYLFLEGLRKYQVVPDGTNGTRGLVDRLVEVFVQVYIYGFGGYLADAMDTLYKC